MQCIFGFGGWNSFYYYLIIAVISKLIKEDFLLEYTNLNIKNHTFMILLLGFISEAFFSFLIYLIINYLEYRRKRKKNLILSQQGIEYKNKNTIDKIMEMKDKPFENYLFNNDFLKKSSSDELIINQNSPRTTSQNRKEVSLIHNDIVEDMSENSFIYIILSCCLILTKQTLSQIVYSINDIFDYYFLNLVILTLILKFYFHENIYRHRLLAVIMVIIASGICLISCLFINTNSNDEDKLTIIETFKGDYYKIFILILVYIIMSFMFCVGILIQKHLMEYKFISPYKILLYKGLIGILGSCIGLIISSNLKCNEDSLNETLNENKNNKKNKIFEFFVCSDNYNGNSYYDHFFSYFASFDNGGRAKETIFLIIFCTLHFCFQISLILVNKFLSPTHYLIAESIYSLIHIPLNYSIYSSYSNANDVKKRNKDLNKFYKSIIHTFGTIILKFIACFFDSIGYIIYLEVVELRFCELNQNIKKNIEQRAAIDGKIENEDNSGSDSDDENEKNN